MTPSPLPAPAAEAPADLREMRILRPGGPALSRRTAQVAALRPGQTLLEVSCGNGVQSLYYARNFSVHVIGIDASADMVRAAAENVRLAGLAHRVRILQADPRALPFPNARFDAVINQCAVGIAHDSQRVLDEMLRVVKPAGHVAIHESTWLLPLPDAEKTEIAGRYDTTPLESPEWRGLLQRAGAQDVHAELQPWSASSNSWKVRRDPDVLRPSLILRPIQRLRTAWHVARRFGVPRLFTALRNERAFFRAVLDGRLGYGLYWGSRPLHR